MKTESKELTGATLKITGEADWDNVLAQFAAGEEHHVHSIKNDGGTVCGIEWLSTANALTVKGLTAGNVYLMEETGAPEGYGYSENIQFMLEDDICLFAAQKRHR